MPPLSTWGHVCSAYMAPSEEEMQCGAIKTQLADYKQGVPATSPTGLVEGRAEGEPPGSQSRGMLVFYFSIYLQVIFLLLLKVYCKQDVSPPPPPHTPSVPCMITVLCPACDGGGRAPCGCTYQGLGSLQAVRFVTMSSSSSSLAELLVLRTM